jgi:transcriptional regulator with XRE-family HTH domain
MTEDQPVSDAVARNLQDLRRRRGMNAAALADACAKVGHPQLTASVIANIESGRRDPQGRRRRAVTVDEAYALAQALEAPVTFLLPPPPGSKEGEWGMFDRMRETAAEHERMREATHRQMEESINELGLDAEHAQMVRDVLGQDLDQEQLEHALLEIVNQQQQVRREAGDG